ncbi:Outer membrane receptor for ferrienterochelin and colicins [Dyadobacter sp. SG02]|uniref:TonB-dependent receptor domain-containing protein n=1 Tax=Dyadobacter sp. SG02 TaxID=1855291 RepID=UPI0008BAAAAB|nr:outer membrane beta-barrel family protein [Dyadobacter sp. SG02]SEJ42576.1 Outer membrane receptor for ferrienterochelin and colicins [Dyadobacter sp. SG02]
MKLVLHLTFLAVFSGLTSTAFAQFPGGGGGGGGFRGGGGDSRGGGNRPQRQTVIPGTAEDTPKGNGKITGVLVDSTSKKPVEFAALSLVDTKTNNPIDGTTTDEKGAFTLTKVASGNFKILISFIGYKTKTINNVKIDRKTELNLGSVTLVPDVVQLNEVEVVGMAQMIEEKVDRLVYNAEKDITSKGGDASDVMKKVPMLTVDLDGNVSLRGSSNVRVLINNKPSTIIATSVADALKQIPADMIKSVEVITSPSARYDAEGSAGIINIITKKSTIQGGTLNLDTGIGNRGSNLGLRGNYRVGKMGFSLGGFGRFNYNMPGKSENLQIGKTSPFSVRQTSDSKNKAAFGSYNLGWDWEIDSKTSLSAGVRYGMRNNKVDQELYTYNTLNDTTKTSFRDVNSKDLSGTWDVNVDYMKTLAKAGQELSISTQYSRNNRTNDYDADVYSLSNAQLKELLGATGNNNSSHNQESTVQVDYQTPIKENQMLEVGGKGIFRQVVSNYDYYSSPELGQAQPASNLNYDQNVAAGYLSYTYTTKSRFTVKAGTRYEYTSIDAQQGEGGDLKLPAYGNLVPSINLSQTFGKGQTIKLAYNRRLQRPGIQFLNPNRNAANPQNITVGNPELKPELTDQLELGTSFFKNSMYINVSTFARFTNSSIESIRTTSADGVITTTYGNIGSKKNYGANIFGNVTFFKRWQLGGGFDFYYADLSNNSPDPALQNSNSGFVLSGRFRTSLNIKNGWGLQAGGFMRGRDVQLQGTQAGFRMYDFGIRKDFKNKRGSIGFGMENFLAPSFKMKTSLESKTFTQNNTNYLYNRGFRVNFSYRLGKMTFVEQKTRRRKSVNNDDQKSDGGGGGMDTGGGGGGAQGGGQTPAVTPPAGGRGAAAEGTGRPQGARPAAADSTARPMRQEGFQGRPGQPGTRPDSTMKRDSTQFRPDSTRVRPDSSTVKPDSTARPAAPADSTALPAKPATPADTTKKN